MTRAPDPRPVYRYQRTAALADLQRTAVLFGQAPDGYLSWNLRHSGPAAFVADQVGLPYRYAARLVWDAFEEGLLVVEPRVPDVESYLLDLVWVEAEEAFLAGKGVVP